MFEVGDLINDQFLVTQRFIGGMGVVYVSTDQVTDQTIVLKTLRDDNDVVVGSPLDEERRDRFEREARAWLNLGDHPNIVRAISFDRGAFPFLRLKFIEGVALNLLINREPEGLIQSEAARYALHIAAALQHAHRCPMPRGGRGVIHRDIKPHNVLIQVDRTALVTDFGLACVGGEGRMTSSKSVMGTLQYMPPEQYQGLIHTNERSDIYSFGVVLYEMLSGKLPFPGRTIPELWHQVRDATPQSISGFRPNIDQELEEIVFACLEKLPEHRPDSAQAIMDRLAPIVSRLTDKDDPSQACSWCGYRANREHLICPLCERAPRPRDVPEAWVCACGITLPERFRFCTKCGTSRAEDVECSQCRRANPREFRFCCHCGHTIGKPPSNA